jgi:hypothetical protein
MSDYNQGVQDALSAYAKGRMTAAEVKRAIKKLGYTADLREAKTGEIQVFPISDEPVSGEYYAFSNGGGVKKMKKGGAAFPDLTGDGKVTRADILKGRGVKGFKGGGCVMPGRGGSFKGIN